MRYKYLKLFFLLSFTVEVTAQTLDLFNAENLEGWTVYGTEKWYVDGGELICESGPDQNYGYLATNKYYDNFELVIGI